MVYTPTYSTISITVVNKNICSLKVTIQFETKVIQRLKFPELVEKANEVKS